MWVPIQSDYKTLGKKLGKCYACAPHLDNAPLHQILPSNPSSVRLHAGVNVQSGVGVRVCVCQLTIEANFNKSRCQMRDPGRGRACVLHLFVLQFGACLFTCVIVYSYNLKFNLAGFAYGRQDLINNGLGTISSIKRDYQQAHNIPLDIAREPGAPWILCGHLKRRKRRRERKKKRDCRSGLRARLRRQPYRPSLLSILHTNAGSVVNKREDLELLMTAKQVHNNCVTIITETWLHPQIPDTAVQFQDRTLHRLDRNSDSGKSRGGGLCVYVQENWCTNSRAISGHCSSDLE